MAGKRKRLTDAGVAKLAPAAREYTVRDTRHAGLGVRVRPSGHRTFVYHRRGSSRARRITPGPAAPTSVEDARRKCRALEIGEQRDPGRRLNALTFGAFVEGKGKTCFAGCKLSTRKAIGRLPDTRILPAFGDSRLDRITRGAVACRFEEYGETAPGGANRALDILRQLLNLAVACGLIDANPASGVKPNPRRKPTRFLFREEVRRLHDALDERVRARPSSAPKADIIRLLLLTGCRRGAFGSRDVRRDGRRGSTCPEVGSPQGRRWGGRPDSRLGQSLLHNA